MRKYVSAVLLLGLWTGAASAQSSVLEFGDSGVGTVASGFGVSVLGAGNLDGLGGPDVVIGAPADNPGLTPSAGSVAAYSGTDGVLLWRVYGDRPNDYIGSSLSGSEDVDGDGRPDLITSSPVGDSNDGLSLDVGLARVLSGATGATLHTWYGDTSGTRFGTGVAGIGLWDGDNVPDFAVGEPLWNSSDFWHPKQQVGRVHFYSGQNFSKVSPGGVIEGEIEWEQFGYSLDRAGDVDSDGRDEVVVGARYKASITGFTVGSASIIGLSQGASYPHLVTELFGVNPGGLFGHSVAYAGDVDGNGIPDIIVGAPLASGAQGTATVFDALSGTTLCRSTGATISGLYGSVVGSAGDVDGDGRDDLIVGAVLDTVNAPFGGSVRLFSFVGGMPSADDAAETLNTFGGNVSGSNFGISVSAGGDVDGDGFADPIVGAPRDQTDNGTIEDRAYVIQGDQPVEVYGKGCGPSLSWKNAPVIGSSDFRLKVTNAPPLGSGFLHFGVQPALVDLEPFGAPGCQYLLASLNLVPLTLFNPNGIDAVGAVDVVLPVPNSQALVGGHIVFQVSVLSNLNALGSLLTAGLKVSIQQP